MRLFAICALIALSSVPALAMPVMSDPVDHQKVDQYQPPSAVMPEPAPVPHTGRSTGTPAKFALDIDNTNNSWTFGADAYQHIDPGRTI